MAKRWILPLALGVAIWAMPAGAHHSIGAAYDTSRQMTIEAVVVQFHFIYPHPFLTAEVKQSSGVAQWTLEMDSRGELSREGMTAETFKPGDRIVVTGSPDRAGRERLYIRKLDRPSDGFQYEQVGRSPRIRPGR